MQQSYSTKELARMLDVSESTIKRWADAGLLRCRKTIGGHRKFTHEDVAEFQDNCGLEIGAAAASHAAEIDVPLEELFAGPDFTELSRRYREAALAGQFGCAAAMLKEARRRGHTLAFIGDRVIAPAMRDIGEMWRAGRVGVMDEHTATFATIQALMEWNPPAQKKQPSEKLALVGCSEGELHTLAAIIVSAILASRSWRVIHFGQHTPLFSFAEAVTRFSPDIVCISITMADNIEHAARDYEKLRRVASKSGTKIILGGAALKDEEVRARFRASHYAPTLDDFLALIEDYES
jgi:MerR family transcriptional regulator, light-induced transcriptional regulator